MAGFFKNAFGGGNALSARDEMKEAVAYFVVMMIYADGDVDQSEVAAARGTLARCGLFSDNDVEEDFALMQKMEKKLRQDTEGNAQAYAEILKRDDWKYTAAAIMTDIMLDDSEMDEGEVHLLSHLAARVGITQTELDAMVGTIRALRRPWGE